MAFLSIPNVKLVGVSACVPKNVVENKDIDFINSEDIEKFINSTGVERRRIISQGQCSSDLCYAAAEKLINELHWDKKDIKCLIFVSQTPDYILPATSCILQSRLEISEECLTLDISLGCSGWIHGLSVVASLMANGTIDKALLLVGDTTTHTTSPKDKSSAPLFGDAGTACALEYVAGAEAMEFHCATDGSGYDAIIIPDGGCRNSFTEQSLQYVEQEPGITRNGLHCILNGMDVFAFGISKAPQTVNKLAEYFGFDKETVDYYLFHQANLFMNEKIRKKLKISETKVPYSLKDFGNTSCATIPLTMVSQIHQPLRDNELEMVACAFGVGLSWGSVRFKTDKICVPELIEI